MNCPERVKMKNKYKNILFSSFVSTALKAKLVFFS
jgi:hypothetical protein